MSDRPPGSEEKRVTIGTGSRVTLALILATLTVVLGIGKLIWSALDEIKNQNAMHFAELASKQDALDRRLERMEYANHDSAKSEDLRAHLADVKAWTLQLQIDNAGKITVPKFPIQ